MSASRSLAALSPNTAHMLRKFSSCFLVALVFCLMQSSMLAARKGNQIIGVVVVSDAVDVVPVLVRPQEASELRFENHSMFSDVAQHGRACHRGRMFRPVDVRIPTFLTATNKPVMFRSCWSWFMPWNVEHRKSDVKVPGSRRVGSNGRVLLAPATTDTGMNKGRLGSLSSFRGSRSVECRDGVELVPWDESNRRSVLDFSGKQSPTTTLADGGLSYLSMRRDVTFLAAPVVPVEIEPRVSLEPVGTWGVPVCDGCLLAASTKAEPVGWISGGWRRDRLWHVTIILQQDRNGA